MHPKSDTQGLFGPMPSYRRKNGESALAWLSRLRTAKADALPPAEADELTHRLAAARAAAMMELSADAAGAEVSHYVKECVRALSAKDLRALPRWIKRGMTDSE
jgi:hypothetical protein